MVRYYAQIAMKLITMSLAMLRDMLIWSTPLELAACLHLANAYMHRELCAYYLESNHGRVSAVNALSAQEIATIALALLILILSIIDWHVPRWVRGQQLLCRILTAMSMQTLRMELACTVMAFLLPILEKDRETKEAPQGSVLLPRVLVQSRRREHQRTRKLPCRILEMLYYCGAVALPLNPMLLQSTSRLRRSDRRARHHQAVAT